MQYYKAQELVQRLKVSERTIYRWIDEAAKGKIELSLVHKGNRRFIEKSQRNIQLLETLAQARLKYKNRKSLKNIKPQKEFFEIFSDDHILDIIKNIEVYREVPFKYTHSGKGAKVWSRHIESLLKGKDNMPKAQTSDLIFSITDYLLELTKEYEKVNLIEVGPGSGLPTKQFVSKLLQVNKLNKYIVFDISNEMINIWKHNIVKWFHNTIQYEIIKGDITKDHFQSTAFSNLSFTNQKPNIINLIFFVGGTIENDRHYSQQLNVINNSMGPNDIFVLEQGINEEKQIAQFPYKESISLITSQLESVVIELLNIKPSYYEIEKFYNSKEKAKLVNIRFKYDVLVEIETDTFSRELTFLKGETLTIWRYNCHSLLEVIQELNSTGFKLLSTVTSITKDAGIFVSEVHKRSF